MYCWGRNREGQLGTGTTNDTTPFATSVSPALTNATRLTITARTTCAVLTTGGVRCWGNVRGGQYQSPTAIAAFEP